MAYDSSYLLDIIKRRAAIPQNQNTFDDPEILAMANEIISEFVLPDVLKARQEFYVHWDDVVPTKGANDNYGWIRIPERAVGQSIISLSEPEDDDPICAQSYWVENQKIYFDPDRVDDVRVRYYLRPGRLVETSSCGVVSSIDRTLGTVTLASVPSGFSSTAKYDFVRGKSGFDLLGKEAPVSLIAGNVLSVAASDIPEELQIGDYMCIADESPIPQIPVEWFPYLAQHTAALILESIGDMEGSKKAETRLKVMRSNALTLISPRIESKSKAIK
jgi:hypothetical protein